MFLLGEILGHTGLFVHFTLSYPYSCWVSVPLFLPTYACLTSWPAILKRCVCVCVCVCVQRVCASMQPYMCACMRASMHVCVCAAAQREDVFEELLLIFWKRPATWLYFVHEIAVSISWSPQCSWIDLVMAETHPAQWVTLHNTKALFFREMWFADYLCMSAWVHECMCACVGASCKYLVHVCMCGWAYNYVLGFSQKPLSFSACGNH